METTDEQWERRIRERFDGFESEPSPDALRRILAEVNREPDKPKPPGWKQPLGIGLLVLLLGAWLLMEWPERSPGPATAGPKTARQASTERLERGRPSRPQPDEAYTKVDATVSPVGPAPQPAGESPVGRSGMKTRIAHMPVPRLLEGASSHPVSFNSRRPAAEMRPTSGPALPVRRSEEATGSVFPDQSSETPAYRGMVLAGLSGRPFRLQTRSSLPTVAAPSVPAAIEPRFTQTPMSVYGQITPLYTFRSVRPIAGDEVVIQDIRSVASLSSRSGWRVKIGLDKAVNRWLNLRAGLAWQQMQQQMQYDIRAASPDSLQVEYVNNQTVRVTPVYRTEPQQFAAYWHYLNASLEGRLMLSRGRLGQQYLVAGGSVGYTLNRSGADAFSRDWQPFLHLAYGLERSIGPHVRLQIEPGLIYNLTPSIDARQHFYIRPYSYGLTVGIQWQP